MNADSITVYITFFLLKTIQINKNIDMIMLNEAVIETAPTTYISEKGIRIRTAKLVHVLCRHAPNIIKISRADTIIGKYCKCW